jgi:hypothetical protein
VWPLDLWACSQWWDHVHDIPFFCQTHMGCRHTVHPLHRYGFYTNNGYLQSVTVSSNTYVGISQLAVASDYIQRCGGELIYAHDGKPRT